jgi:hypothetical protein
MKRPVENDRPDKSPNGILLTMTSSASDRILHYHHLFSEVFDKAVS